MSNNFVNKFDILAISLSVLHYFNDPNKIIFRSISSSILLNISAKPCFPYVIN